MSTLSKHWPWLALGLIGLIAWSSALVIQPLRESDECRRLGTQALKLQERMLRRRQPPLRP